MHASSDCKLTALMSQTLGISMRCFCRRLSKGGMGSSGKLRDGRVTDQLSEADGMQQPCELTVEFEEAASAQVGWSLGLY